MLSRANFFSIAKRGLTSQIRPQQLFPASLKAIQACLVQTSSITAQSTSNEIGLIKEKHSPSTCELVEKLRQQLRYYAVVNIKGNKFTVTENDTVCLSHCPELTLGDELELNNVLELGSADYSIIGNPQVSSDFYNIKATVVEHVRGPSFPIVKFKRRKGYRREYHYHNYYTLLKIHKLDIKKLA